MRAECLAFIVNCSSAAMRNALIRDLRLRQKETTQEVLPDSHGTGVFARSSPVVCFG